MGNINTSGCYYIGGELFACADGFGGIDLTNISLINGLPPGTGGEGGAPQTPWLSNINGGGFSLSNVNNITLTGTLTTGGIYVNNGATILGALQVGAAILATGNVTGNNLISNGCFYIGSVPLACSDGAGGIALGNITTINNSPISSFLQTPWLQNIDAASWFLSNAGGIGINRAASAGYGIALTGVHTASILANNTSASGFAGLQATTPSVTMYVGVGGNSASLFPGVPLIAGTSGLAFSTNFSSASLFIASNTGNNNVGVKNAAPAYSLDVTGDVNSTGCYRINAVPFACTDGAGGINLSNITYINGNPPGGSATPPAPPNTAIQWNNGGAFGGSANFLWDNANSVLSLTHGSLTTTLTQSQFSGLTINALNGGSIYLYGNGVIGNVTGSYTLTSTFASGPTNVFSVQTTGSGVALTVSGAGNVGVRTGGAAYPLEVYGQNYVGRFYSTNTFCGLILDHLAGAGGETVLSFRTGGVEAAIIEYDTDEDALIFWTGARDAAFSTLCCDTNSRVGILTTSPAYELDVNGDCNISGTYRINGVPISSGGGFWQGGSGGAIYYNGGNVGIGNTATPPPFSAAGYTHLIVGPQTASSYVGVVTACGNTTVTNNLVGALVFANYGATGPEYRVAEIACVLDGAVNSGALQFFTFSGGGIAERMRITSAGNVGIGTTSPNANLCVVGSTGIRIATASSDLGVTDYEINRDSGSGALYFTGLQNQYSGYSFKITGGGSLLTPLTIAAITGNIGIGTNNPRTYLTVIPSANPTTWSNFQLCIGEQSNTPGYGLYFGYSVEDNQGYIESVAGAQGTTLHLNHFGSGPVMCSGPFIVGAGYASGSIGDISVARPGGTQGYIFFGGAQFIGWDGSAWQFSPALPSSGISGISGYWSNGGGGTGPYGGAGYSGVQLNAGSNMSVACAAGSNPGVQTVIFTVGYVSDMRLKDYAEPLQGGIDIINQIHPIYAQWNGLMDKPKGKAIATVSAQDLQVVMPYAVDPIDVQLDPEVDVTTEILSYDPVAITLQCVLAIQQLVERLERLESRIEPYIH